MKYKTFSRGFSTFQTGAFGYATYIETNMLLNINYQQAMEFMLGDNPLPQKILAGGLIAGTAVLTGLAGVATLDGIVSTIRGQPFYGIMKTLEKVVKNPKKKEKITNEIERYGELRDRKISFP